MLPEMKLPEGPWLHEPDFAKWRDPETGLLCTIVRNRDLGNLCGYVRLPHGKLRRKIISASRHSHRPGYFTSHLRTIEVHGGLIYSRHSSYHKMSRGYWIGFDCAHAWDLVPGMSAFLRSLSKISGDSLSAFERDSVYRDFAYVKAEVTSLARQVAEINRKF